jgi:hypothetical protein
MNTLVAAAGHAWIGIPGTLRAAYADAVAQAVTTGDAGPFCTLLAMCAGRRAAPPA